MKKKIMIFLIFFIILMFLSSSNATTKKGLFGEELRYKTNGYSVAQIEGYDTHPKDDIYQNDYVIDMYYSNEGYNTPLIYVYRIKSEDIGMDEQGDNMFAKNYSSTAYLPEIHILNNDTVNGLNLYYIEKTENAIHGKGRTYNYVVYAVGQKEGYTYCILHEDKNVECRNESVNTNVYKIYTDEFIEIFNSIERIES